MDMVYMRSDKVLSWAMVVDILQEFDPESTPHVDTPFGKPKGGEVYIFFTLDAFKAEDYKIDEYQWRNNGAKDTEEQSLTL